MARTENGTPNDFGILADLFAEIDGMIRSAGSGQLVGFVPISLRLPDSVRWTPTFRPLSAENKMDSRGPLSSLLLFVSRSLCASNPFGKERTSRAWHYPPSLSRLLGFQYLPPKAV